MSDTLPPGWTSTTLAELGTWYGGGTPSKSNPAFWTNGSVPWLSPKDMGCNTIVDTQDHITRDAIDRSSTKLVPAESVAFVVRSGILERKFPVAVVPFETTLNQDMKAIVPFGGIDVRWLAWALRALEHKILTSCRKAGTTVASIATPALQKLRIPLPPLAEQRRIVEALEGHLSRLDAAKSSVTTGLRRTDDLKNSLLDRAVRGRWMSDSTDIDPGVDTNHIQSIARARAAANPTGKPPFHPDPVAGFDTPAGWFATSLDALSVDYGYGTSLKCDYGGDGVPVLRIPNIKNGRIDLGDLKSAVDADVDLSRFMVDSGDLLFVRTNGSADLIGRVGVVEDNVRYAFASYLIRFSLVPDVVEPAWIRAVVSSPPWRRHLMAAAASSAGQYNLSSKTLARLLIPLPPRNVQHRILRALDEAVGTAARLQSSVQAVAARSSNLRAALLERAFSGQLVPQDSTDEPAAMLLSRIEAERGGEPKMVRARRPRTGAPRVVPPGVQGELPL
ncbi:restriction endonuclease subunit S [Nocardia neocaledoniensis]|uniref:restriction endonuclease subunit S n=1 Tax=Nocardia neocaledoniensis TaxID=236511 RepID=UPI0024580EF9|nr:restriction endonuclease subunit S [Nocardia neocaledoniensis]